MKRNPAEIKVWMLRNGHTIESIRKALGYANNTSVSLTITGARSTKRVLEWLRAQGCPERYLGLPRKMREAMRTAEGRS